MARRRTVPITPEELEDTREPRGLGPAAAGQSGDLQGLSEVADADSESVEELVEEGQAMEAETIAGVEKAADGQAQVRPHQRPEDDVPPEYRDRD